MRMLWQTFIFQQICVEHLQYTNHLNDHWDTTMNKTIFVLERFGIWTEKKAYEKILMSQPIVTRKIMLKLLNGCYWLKNPVEALTNIHVTDSPNYPIFSILFVNHTNHFHRTWLHLDYFCHQLNHAPKGQLCLFLNLFMTVVLVAVIMNFNSILHKLIKYECQKKEFLFLWTPSWLFWKVWTKRCHLEKWLPKKCMHKTIFKV